MQALRAIRPTTLSMNHVQTQTHLTNAIGRKPIDNVCSFAYVTNRQPSQTTRSQSLPNISSELASRSCHSNLNLMCLTGTYPLNSPQGNMSRTCLPDLTMGCEAESTDYEDSPAGTPGEEFSPDSEGQKLDREGSAVEQDGGRETRQGGSPSKPSRGKLQRWKLSPMQRRKIEKQMHLASTELRIS